MSTDWQIEYRSGGPGTPWALYALFSGRYSYATASRGRLRGRAAIRARACDLRAELREESPKAMVRVVDPRGRAHNVNGD